MKKLLIAFFILLACVCAACAQINSTAVAGAGFDKLSDSQKAAILADVAKQVEANKAPTLPTSVEDVDKQIEKVDKWVDYGTKIGKGLGGAAKEVGVAANEFAKTPVGILTSVVIAWHFMGSAIGIPIHIFGGIAVFIFGNLGLFLAIQKMKVTTEHYEYDKGERKVMSTTYGLPDDTQWVPLTFFFVILIASLITAFTY